MNRFVKGICAIIIAFVIFAGEAYASGVSAYGAASRRKTVTNVEATPLGTSSIEIMWDADDDADAFVIYKYDSSKKKWTKVGTTYDKQYTVKNLRKSGSKYRLAVEAVKISGGRKKALRGRAVVTSATRPGKVGGVRETGNFVHSQTTIKWNAVTGADGYCVYRYDSIEKEWRQVADVTRTTYSDRDLSSARVYSYRVSAYVTVDGDNFEGAYSKTVRTATTPRAVSSATYLEKQVLKESGDGEYLNISSDREFGYVHGYKVSFSKVRGAAGYIIYYQDVRDVSQADVSKAKRLMSTTSTVVSLGRTKKAGFTRVFWVSTYYKRGGKIYRNAAKTPVTFAGNQYIYKNASGKTTEIREELFGAVDDQISVVRYYKPNGRLKKYDEYIYDSNAFIKQIRTYNAAGKLIKTEKWR